MTAFYRGDMMFLKIKYADGMNALFLFYRR